MHEHRTIPQRLGDHDALIAELIERVEKLEEKRPSPPKETKP